MFLSINKKLNMKMRKHLAILFKDKQPKKNIIKVIFEVLACFFLYKEFPFFYFHKMLYRRDIKNFRDYLSTKEFKTLNRSKILHNPTISVMYRNKLLFDRILTDAGIKIPILIAYKIDKYIYIKKSNESFYCDDNNSLKKVLSEICRHSQEIFVKSVDAQGGAGCFVINKSNIDTIMPQLLSIKVALFQERLQQHQEISNIYPNSINTVRIDTYIDDQGDVIFLNALIRFGANNSINDNATSGGFFVPVNLETGVIGKKGMQFQTHGGNVFYKHPDTQGEFCGVKIPFFNEAKDQILKTLKLMPERIVGWDIAITKMGPVIVEGNENPSLFMSDLASGGYKKNIIMKEILKKTRRINNNW